MNKIKTREKVKDIKALDKSAVIGQRMKNAFIRSKRDAAALMDNRQTTPSEYAGDKVEYAADHLAHDTANIAVSGTKTAARHGRKLFQHQRENTSPTEQAPVPELSQGTAPDDQPPQRHSGKISEERLPRQRTDPPRDGQYPQQDAKSAQDRRLPRQRTDLPKDEHHSRQDTSPVRSRRLPHQRTDPPTDGQHPQQGTGPTQDKRLPCQQTGTAPERQTTPAQAQRSGLRWERKISETSEFCPIARSDGYGTCDNEERGQAFAKKQTAKKVEWKRQVKNETVRFDQKPQVKPQDAAKAPQRLETAVNTAKTPIKSVKRPTQVMSQTAKATSQSAKGTIKSAQRTVKTAQRTAKSTVKTAQHTSKAATKTAEHTAKAAKMTAHAARATAKAAIAATKAVAKGISAAAKAMIASAKALVAAIAAGGWIAIVIICLIGLIAGSCFGIFFSGEDSSTGQTMPAIVQEINQEYEDKLEEIKTGTAHDTLELSGACAAWREVLAFYAVKSTTDPNNPQEVVTMDGSRNELLKEIFWDMTEISSQTSVDGTTTSHKTAEEMADVYCFDDGQRQQLVELLLEDNRKVWSSLLYGIGEGSGEIVAVALSQVGNVGGQPYWSWYGYGSRVAWCACFVSWCANECGYIDSGVMPKFAGCVVGAQWFKNKGQWRDRSFTPEAGQIIFFDQNQDGVTEHVGIVERCENGVVYTVEGNAGDVCRQLSYSVGSQSIYGYGVFNK